MNARQMKKRLKKRIDKLQSYNDLMRRIIADSPKMQELYDAYTKPLNVTHTTRHFQEYRVKREIPLCMADVEGTKKYIKREMALELFESIKDSITYEVDVKCMIPTITASIFVGRK